METRVDFESCDLPNANSMTIHVMAAVAENEAKAISQRTKDALKAAKARGVKLGADRAGAAKLTAEAREKGQKAGRETNRQKAIDEYADVLPIAEAMRANDASLIAIAKHLNSEGFRTRRNADWTETQVFRMLKRAKG
jgi:DNA invertase Pin-like site-specific DNA recombinase